MSDIRTVFIDMDRGADLALESFALATDDGLETAVSALSRLDFRTRSCGTPLAQELFKIQR